MPSLDYVPQRPRVGARQVRQRFELPSQCKELFSPLAGPARQRFTNDIRNDWVLVCYRESRDGVVCYRESGENTDFTSFCSLCNTGPEPEFAWVWQKG